MHIRHVIAGVGGSAPKLLQEAHSRVLASAVRAVADVPIDVTVEIVLVGLPDEAPPEGPWRFHPTRRMPLGEEGFSTKRRLPFLADLICPLQESNTFDIGIVTNADIELADDFYGSVHDHWSRDGRPASVTRMTHGAWPASGPGSPDSDKPLEHPGHDCFLASSSDWKRARAGDVVLGAPGVMKSLMWSLSEPGRPVRVLHGTGWTRHEGDERPWAGAAMSEYAEHNRAALRRLARELITERGRVLLTAVPSVRPYLNEGPDEDVMVFSLNPGRSGSESLARLLASSPQVSAGHEREPMMMGPWLRMVGFEGQAATRGLRRFKAKAIEVELELGRPSPYIDTSHLFLYTFADVVLEHFHDRPISVVRLHRDPMEVAKSLVELGYFSRTSTLGMDWHFWPTWPTSLFPMSIHEVTGEWDLVFGSLVDFYRRQSDFLARTGDQVGVVPLRTRDIGDPAWQDSLAGAVGLDLDTLSPAVASRSWNRKISERIRSVSTERVSDEFAAFCRRFAIEFEELESIGWNGPFA